MATATVNADVNTTKTSGKTTTETWDQAYGYQIEKDKDGKETGREAVMISVDKATELEKEGKFEGAVVTIRCDYPANWEGLLDYANKTYLDDEGKPRDIEEVKAEIVKLFSNGAKGKVMNRTKSRLTQTKDGKLTFSEADLKDGVLDVTEEITSGSKRVFLTEEQKTWKNLSNLPEELRKQMFDVYLTSIGKEKGNYPEV